MEQPGGVSRFTIDLNGAFCFRTYPLLATENSVTKHHSLGAFRFGTLSSGGRKFGCQRSQRSFARWFTSRCISAGVSPVLGRPRASRHFSFAHSIKNKPLCAFSVCQNVI